MERVSSANDNPSLQRGLAAVVLMIFACAGGCRGNAQRDLYADKMAGEIRVLEDQLYAADYENKTLREKLRRARNANGVDDPPPKSADTQSDRDDRDFPSGLGGEDASPDTRLLPPPAGTPRGDDDESIDDRRIDVPGKNGRSDDSDSGLVPPDESDLEMPEIEIGSPAPPLSSTGEPELPPNRIPKTDAQQQLEESFLPPPKPAGLALHPGFSGSHKFDDEESSRGVYLVIHFVDDEGKPLDMSDTEIDAELSIIILDPAPDVEDPRLGRWDFSAEQIEPLRRDAPTDSIHIALPWADNEPAGDEVTAFLRLSNGDQHLEGEANIHLRRPEGVAGWKKTHRTRR